MTSMDDAAALIRRRLDELGDEQIKLERTLAALGNEPPPPDRASRPAADGGGTGRRRGRPTRKEEVLAQVRANPSIRTAEIARAIGISTNQVSNLLTGLKRDGALKKDRRNQGWILSA